MSNLVHLPTRAYVSIQNRIASSKLERGSATIEYGGLALIAVAVVLAILSIVTGGLLNRLFTSLLSFVLERAADMIKG